LVLVKSAVKTPNYSLAEQLQEWAMRGGGDAVGSPTFAGLGRAARHAPKIAALTVGIADYGLRLRALLRSAEWMVLEDAAVDNLVRWSYPPTCPLIRHAVGLARAPFRATWIEWDIATFMRAQQKNAGDPHADMEILNSPGARAGVLIERRAADDSTVWSMRLFANEDRSIAVSPLVAWISCDGPLTGVEAAFADEPLLPVMSLFGDAPERQQTSPGAIPEWAKQYARCPALSHIAYDLDGYGGSLTLLRHVKAADIFQGAMREMLQVLDTQAGTLRFALLGLALIDQAAIEYVHRPGPAGRRIVRGHLVPGHAHRLVKIKIDLEPRRVTRYLQRALAARGIRAHQVRGHWQRYGGVRHWKDTYRRGDESLGWVDHDYVVEPETGK
jgi:hypothetical protein